ncbi:MAG: PAS domain S-box protein [Acidobacteriota bacterium]|nr:PAS domain S-box protein [Acidobacteriota bacterium]
MVPDNSQIAIELLDNSPDAMVALSSQGTVVYWNKGAEHTFGYSKDEAIGRGLNDLIIPAGRIEEEKKFFDEVIKSGHSTFQSVRRRKDGSLVPVDISTQVIRDDRGGVKYILLSKKDITDRKLVEEARQASELRYRRLFESAKDGILILDADSGQIMDANPYLIEMLGISKEELSGKELWEIGPFKDIVASKLAFAELQEQGYIRYENLPLETREGLIRQVEFVSNSYLAGENRVIQCNIRDITERKLAEERAVAELQNKTHELALMTQQLWQASKLATMGELAASVAHELNNPLATICLHAEVLVGQLAADDPNRQSLLVIEQEVDRMATLVSNLLLFSRRSHRQIATVDLREELGNLLDFIKYHLRSHKIDIVRDFAAVVPTVQSDRQQLRQVFLNLISNAGDAMPEGGTLTVRSRAGAMAGAQTAIVEFSDTGTGIQKGDLPRLWEPFFTTKPEGKGIGLGLAICRRIVEEHRGTIEIETSPGKGATVRVTLPATDEGIEVAA